MHHPHSVKSALFLLVMLLSLVILSCSKDNPDNPNPTTVPSMTTRSAFDISSTSARTGGTVTFDGGSPISERGVCYSTSPDPTIADSKSLPVSGMTSYECIVTGLNPSTLYYIKAYAQNANGVGYGEQKSFTTLGGGGELPVVLTAAITSITSTTASGGGQVTAQGGSPVTARGICWSTNPNPTLANSFTTNGDGLGSFTSSLSGLTPSTTYYIRAYATNSSGTTYGSQVEFTTTGGGSGQPCPGLPSVTDPRDGQSYTTVQIGTQCWMRQNINYAVSNSWCYDNNNAHCSTYGRLYNWSAALGACPPGWHLPSKEEFTLLIDFLVAGVAGMKMKSTSGWYENGNGTNESGFTALPGGIRSLAGAYEGLTRWGIFWTSTSDSPNQAWIRMLENSSNGTLHQPGHKEMGRTVRCLRD